MVKTYGNPETFLEDYLDAAGVEKFKDRIKGTEVFGFDCGARLEDQPFSAAVVPNVVAVYADENTLQELVGYWRTQDSPVFMPMIVDGNHAKNQLEYYSVAHTSLLVDVLKMPDVTWSRKRSAFTGVLNSEFLVREKVTELLLNEEVLQNLSFEEVVKLSTQSNLTLDQAREVINRLPKDTLKYPGGLVLINPGSREHVSGPAVTSRCRQHCGSITESLPEWFAATTSA